MNEKVMITGGAGFIGLHLAKRLLEEGFQVDLLDNFSRAVNDKELKLKGAQLVGRFYVLRNQNRVFIEFNTLIIDQRSIDIKAVAMDYSDQKRGLIAKVDERVGQRLLEGIVKTATGMLATMTAKTVPLLDKTVQTTEALSLDTLETERLVSVEPKQFLLFFDQLAQI